MRKYYYTDPIKAVWMMKEFNITIYSPEDDIYQEEILSVHDMLQAYEGNFGNEAKPPFYIHPDCHEILKPQVDDVIRSYNNVAIVSTNHHENKIGDLLSLDQILKWGDIEIIQRNGKAFFMPEVEKS